MIWEVIEEIFLSVANSCDNSCDNDSKIREILFKR